MLPRLFACAMGLLAVSGADADAAGPKAVPTKAKVMRGGSLKILLDANDRNLNRIEYRIIGAPRYGSLSGLTQYNGPDRQGPGEVTYTHGNDDSSNVDTFTFEAISKPGNLRGRGRVTVRIVDAPAELRITPSILDFGAAAIGDPAVQQVVELANEGGGTIQGFLEVPAPFSLANDGMFVLHRGERTRIHVLFTPERPGEFPFRIQPVPGDPAKLTIKGEALSPFSVEVGDPSFRPQDDSSRVARATVTNASRRPQTVSIVLPPDSPVEPVEHLEIPPGATNEVVMRIPPETKTRVAPFAVRFETGDYAVTLDFQAPPIPPQLVVLSSPDFGSVKPGTAAKATLVLSNAGGAIAECRLQSTKLLGPEDGTPAFTVAPGTSRDIGLRLMPRKDQDLPTNVVVSFRDQELSVPLKAQWTLADASPTPSPSPTPTPTPPTGNFELNEDIKFVAPPEGPAIAWREKPGYSNCVLQHRSGSTGPWESYELPAPQEGLIEWLTGWFRDLVGRIEKFLTTEIKRTDIVDPMAAPEQPMTSKPIDQASQDNDLWRLVATPQDGSAPRPVSGVFRIDGNRLVAAEDPAPPAKSTPTPTPTPPPVPAPAPKVDSRRIGPVTEIESAGIKPERTSALVQIALKHNPDIRGFRLERGSMVSRIDPKTGIPQAPSFEKIDPPGAEVELLGLAEGEADGKKFTICSARISNLPEGSRTYWRVVPQTEKRDLPPTTVILVDTLPRPPFPWNTVLLVSLILLLVGVLYLRWRINRPPD